MTYEAERTAAIAGTPVDEAVFHPVEDASPFRNSLSERTGIQGPCPDSSPGRKRVNILLDMDGVIANFFVHALERHAAVVRERFGIEIRDLDSGYPRGEWEIASTLGITIKEFWQPVDHREFWDSVPPYPGAREFVKVLRGMGNVTVLTSSALNTEGPGSKIRWLNHHIAPDLPCMVCHRGAKKALLARDDALLIDDYHKNLEPFFTAGGRVIKVHMPWNDLDPNLSFFRVPYIDVLKRTRAMIKGMGDE